MEKNIVSAITAEKQYIYDKTIGERRDISIYDYLLPFGYNDLKEFRKDKILYQIKESGIKDIEISADEVRYSGNSIFINYAKQSPCFLWNINLNNGTVFLPSSCNKEYEGFDIIKTGYDCESDRGNIISFDGDLDVVMIVPKELSAVFGYITEIIVEHLRTLTDKEVVSDGNDIMVDGYKVSGAVFVEDEKNAAALYHISFADESDLVRSYFPNSTKVPGHIDFTDANNLLNHILLWLQ